MGAQGSVHVLQGPSVSRRKLTIMSEDLLVSTNVFHDLERHGVARQVKDDVVPTIMLSNEGRGSAQSSAQRSVSSTQ